MTIDETLKSRIVAALRAGDRNARNPEDRQEARELVYLLTVERPAVEAAIVQAAENMATVAPVVTPEGLQPMNHAEPCPANGCERAGTGDLTVTPCGPDCSAPAVAEDRPDHAEGE